jgi:hypothetical protein
MNQITLSITAFLLLILWSAVTIALTITLVGIFVLFMMGEDGGWYNLPHQIIDRTINPKP